MEVEVVVVWPLSGAGLSDILGVVLVLLPELYKTVMNEHVQAPIVWPLTGKGCQWMKYIYQYFRISIRQALERSPMRQ